MKIDIIRKQKTRKNREKVKCYEEKWIKKHIKDEKTHNLNRQREKERERKEERERKKKRVRGKKKEREGDGEGEGMRMKERDRGDWHYWPRKKRQEGKEIMKER